MLNSIVMAQSLGVQQPPAFPHFHVLKYVLAKPWTSLNLKILPANFTVAQGTQATPGSSAKEIVSPGWRPSWVWYLAEAPALSAVACNSVPVHTLLRGSNLWASAGERGLMQHVWKQWSLLPVFTWDGTACCCLSFRFYQARDGQSWGSGNKDMESERAGCGKQDIA